MTALGIVERLRRLWAWVRATRARAALVWAGSTFLLLAALAGSPGIARDEATVLEAADPALRAAPSPRPPAHRERSGGTPAESKGPPLRGGEGEGPTGAAVRPAPPLGTEVAAASHTAFSRLGVSHLRAARLGTALFGALLSAALVLLAWELSGAGAALLAPALFWAAPRHLHAGLVATPDLALAALAAAAVVGYRRAAVAPDRRRRLRAAAQAGLLFGLALAARADAWILLPALAAHALLARALVPPTSRATGGVEARLRVVPAALVAMAALGPLVLLAAWPSFWTSPFAHALAFAPGGPGRGTLVPGAPLRGVVPAAVVVTTLTVPATLLLAYLAGIGHALLRVVRVVRRRAPGPAASDEALLLLCAAAPLAAAAAGIAPVVSGVRPWLHAMPFLAVLGARALLAAARVAWPARAAPVAASLVLLVLWPAVRAELHFHPAGSSAWNELAGGAPGAAALGMSRQDGGEAVASLLDALAARAPQGARVYWPSTAPAAVRAFARDGRLRPDLAVAGGPGDADLAVVALDGGSRDAEYRTWSSFRTARPAAGAYLDEVPLAFVYARPGAWR